MSLATWLTVVSICLLGAMSPGPSLAVVLRQTLTGGRRHGCVAALAHGLGIGLYAFGCISGLAFLITASPGIFAAFQWAGAAYLIWLGIQGLMAKAPPEGDLPEVPGTGSAAWDGFMIAFLNPKIAVFFIALFSQVIGPDTNLGARLIYATTAMVLDAGWYMLVAFLFSTPAWLERLRRHTVWFERLFGIILIGLAARLLIEVIAGR